MRVSGVGDGETATGGAENGSGGRMLDRLLLHPGVNKTFAMLDDSKSMASIATRDMVDSSGRTYMEYQRNPHGGRERLVEELLTWAIWGFGVKKMKDLYNSAMTSVPLLKKLNIEQPNLDISLLPGKGSGTDRQKLNYDLVEKFARRFEPEGQGQYHQLLKLLKSGVNRKLLNTYRHSSIAKFLLATGMPVATIAFGIPTLNQWWTRRKIETEHSAQTPAGAETLPKAATLAGHATATAPSTESPVESVPVSPLQNAFRKAGLNSGTTFQPARDDIHPRKLGPTWPPTLPIPALRPAQPSSPPESPSPVSVTPGSTPAGSYPTFSGAPSGFSTVFSTKDGATNQAARTINSKSANPKFGGIGEIASSFLQNERYNTLLVDGTISGGRIVKARNWHERLEIAFREAAVIFFLYYAQGFIQNRMIGKTFEKLFKIPSQLDFPTLKHLHDHIPAAQFHERYQRGLAELAQEMSAHGKLPTSEGLTLKDGMKQLLGRNEQRDPALVDTIRHYFLEGRQGNMILDTAQAAGWIPTFKDKAGRQCLDLSQKIETGPIFDLIHVLGSMAEKTRSNPTELRQLLRKTMTGRAGAWLLANGVCAFALSYAAPKIQHYITYLQTGKNDFPGIDTGDATSKPHE